MKNIINEYTSNRDGLYRFLAIIGGSLFFAHELNIAVFVRIFEFFNLNNEIAVTITSFIPFILSIPLLLRRAKRLKVFYIIYFASLLFFAISILRNLGSLDIYFRPRFGIHKVFLPSGGLFAIYYINLLYDKNNKLDLVMMLLFSGLGMYFISILQFLMANIRGYWLTEASYGEMIKINYSLIFGFNMGLAVNILLGFWFYEKKSIYFILAILGYYTIITDGNRMGMALAIAFWILMILHNLINYIKYKGNSRELSKSFIGLIIFVCVIIGAFFLQKNNIDPVESVLEAVNLKKDTNDNGKYTEDNIVEENGTLWFYLNGKKTAVGMIEIEEEVYYVKEDGSIVQNEKYYTTDNNGILPEGEYYFKEDGKLDIESLSEKDEKAINDLFSTNPNISRNLSFLGIGGLLFDNSRSAIYELVIEGIKDSPIIGVGAYGDRIYTSERFIWGHSHNILLEMAINFGVIITIIFVIGLANTFFVMLFKKRNLYTIFYLVFVATATLLITSNSFWLEPYIWAILAFSFIEMDKEDFWIYKLYRKIRK